MEQRQRRSTTHWLVVVVLLLVPLASLAQTPSPSPDWIDEFPSVTEVAHAAYEELKVTAQRNRTDPSDDDAIAINLAGTFVALRQIMLLKYDEEPSMAEDREEKLRKLLASYLEAELTIGRGWAGRRGYITRGSPSGMGCHDEPCYRRWFLLHLNANSGRAEYRQRVLNRLFPCGTLAKELNDLRQKHAMTVPYMPSPAATLTIDPEVAGIGPAGCAAYGGDSRQNGLCDGWTPPPPTPSAGGSGAFRTTSSACQLIVLTKVQMANGGGLLVSIAPTSAKEGDVVTFSVSRSATDAPDGSPAFWERQAQIAKGDADLQVVVARDARLAPDPARPFLVVDTTSTRSRGPTHCEQPLHKWEQRHMPPPAFRGLHGPYDSVEDAMRRDGATAIAWWLMNAGRSDLIPDFVYALIGSRREFGYVIVQDNRRPDGKFYTTPPVPSSHVPKGSEQPTFLARDYGTSFARAFEGSCENESDYKIAALVHTHPDEIDFYPINDFSMDDYNVLFEFRAKGMPIPKMVMLNGRDRYIRIFTTRPTDRPFWGRELERKRFPDWNDLWNNYTERVMILCVGAALALPSCQR